MGDLEKYWQDGFPQVEGWVDHRLLPFIQVVGAIQQAAGISGNIAEIGVFHGKFLIALAHLANEGEKVTGIDVFEDQDKNLDGAGVGSRDRVEANIGRFAPIGLDYEFVQADSIALNLADKVDLLRRRGPFRLFSVDGCHTLQHTHADLVTAQDCLASGGVVILDDYMQPHWPGVTAAVDLFHSRAVPRIAPFLYCCHKLFFVGHGWQNHFFDRVLSQFGSQTDLRVCQMFGSHVCTIYP